MLQSLFYYIESHCLNHPLVNQFLRQPESLSHSTLTPPLVVLQPGLVTYLRGYSDVSLTLYWLTTTTTNPVSQNNVTLQEDTSLQNFLSGSQVLREVLNNLHFPLVSESYQPAKFHGHDHLSGCMLQVTLHVPTSFCWDKFGSVE